MNSTFLVILILVVVVLALGATFYKPAGGSVPYACMTLSPHGNNVEVTTSGVIHISSSNNHDYISCSEGSPLPSTSTAASCLRVMPQYETPPYPGAASTYYYYLTTTTGTVSVQGAGINATEITPPSSVSILVTC